MGLMRALALAVTAVVAFAACSAADPTSSYCVYENGAVEHGRCLTMCESECALAAANGCGSPDCVTRCDAEDAARSPACRDASYVRWRCLRVAGGPAVRCESGSPTFVASPDPCPRERADERAACTLDAAPDAR
jgi:hypothetical protein